MLRVTFDAVGPLHTVLCLGAHSDDIEIGCGGTIRTLTRAYPGLRVRWIVFSGDAVRAKEAREGAARFLKDAGESEAVVRQFRPSFFPYEGKDIKEYFESLKALQPDLIFTHYRQDLHQDHRLVSDLTWNTFRDHLILEYEIPKYDGDLGTPNVYVGLDEAVAREKVRHIMECFASQRDKHWFTEDTFLSIMRLRGMESGGAERYAEGFYSRKMVLGASRHSMAPQG